LHGALLDEAAPLTPSARALLRSEIERERLTGRGYHRIRRVARTIADLGPEPPELVDVEHVSIALSLRSRMRAATSDLVA
jgi:magnesium chelatase family protein